MSAVVHGSSLGLANIVAGSGGKRQPDGTVTCDLTFAIPYASLLSSFPVRGVSKHPYLPSFLADDFSWTNQGRGGVCLLKVTYIAILASAQPQGGSLPPDVEAECESIASEEAVTTLPNFLVTAGGLPAICQPINGSWPVDDNGVVVTINPKGTHKGEWPTGTDGKPLDLTGIAVFDTFGQNSDPSKTSTFNPQVGRFLYFPPGSPLVGLEAILLPRGEYKYSYATTAAPSLAGVGTIGKPAGAPTLNTGFNWLLTSRAYRRTGIIYRVSETWRASGPRGWNLSVYNVGSQT